MVNIKSFGPATQLGESPHWDYNEQVLYFVDHIDKKVYRYNPKNGEISSVKIDAADVLSLVIPIEEKKNEFIITIDRSLAKLTWDGGSSTPTKVEYIATVDNEEDKAKYSLFNDGKVDPTGRLWAATRSKLEHPFRLTKPGVGSLFSFSKGQAPTTHVKNLNLSNGLAWSSDLKKMYFIDSADGKVYVFDFDAIKGTISNRQVAFDFEASGTKGVPDGMTIDAEDKLWVACFGASQIIRIDPVNGTLISKIDIPAKQVTSVTFGGPNLDELYVTTAAIRLSEEEMKNNIHGKTFHITELGVKGTKNLSAQF